MSCTVLRGLVTTIALIVALSACGRPPGARPADSGQSNTEQTSPNEPGLVWRSFVARDMEGAGVPRDAHIFEPGAVGYYMMASGATNDTIQAGLVVNGATIQECDADVLDGDDGYFCHFDLIAAGQYEVWVLLNGELLEARAFEIIAARDPSVALSTEEPASPSSQHLSSIPWRERPSERDHQRAYPRRALERGVSGQVLLRCTILDRGEVECAVVQEAPSGMEFGAAALRLSRRFRMLARFEDGQSTAGRVIDVPVEFRAQ